MAPARRTRLFAAFGGAMAEPIEQWWRWSVTAPYQVRWDRRPYRSSSPATGAEGRVAHLVQVLRSTSSYPDRDVVWFARWAPYVDHAWTPDLGLGPVFAAAIAAGRTDVRDALLASAHGRDEVGGMGSHVVVGLLAAPDPAGWEVVEALLWRPSARRACASRCWKPSTWRTPRPSCGCSASSSSTGWSASPRPCAPCRCGPVKSSTCARRPWCSTWSPGCAGCSRPRRRPPTSPASPTRSRRSSPCGPWRSATCSPPSTPPFPCCGRATPTCGTPQPGSSSRPAFDAATSCSPRSWPTPTHECSPSRCTTTESTSTAT